jgi:hypothetical protein
MKRGVSQAEHEEQRHHGESSAGDAEIGKDAAALIIPDSATTRAFQ